MQDEIKYKTTVTPRKKNDKAHAHQQIRFERMKQKMTSKSIENSLCHFSFRLSFTLQYYVLFLSFRYSIVRRLFFCCCCSEVSIFFFLFFVKIFLSVVLSLSIFMPSSLMLCVHLRFSLKFFSNLSHCLRCFFFFGIPVHRFGSISVSRLFFFSYFLSHPLLIHVVQLQYVVLPQS